jgi:TetR/AcrR family transcriptional repressor of nem operon
MREPEVTKERILESAGILFNTQGYKATSLSDITTATGLTKGAIYRHFNSKEELENKSLLFLSARLMGMVREIVKSQPSAGLKLRAVFSFFRSYITDPPISGGCPLLNAAIESDDTDPQLKEGALAILNNLRDSLIHILEKGKQYKQISTEIDSDFYATLIIASLEGAIMMSKLRGDNSDIEKVIRHLDGVVTQIEV